MGNEKRKIFLIIALSSWKEDSCFIIYKYKGSIRTLAINFAFKSPKASSFIIITKYIVSNISNKKAIIDIIKKAKAFSFTWKRVWGI